MGKVIGYTQGTYDMFHIGHLNLIKNAKRRCKYVDEVIITNTLDKKEIWDKIRFDEIYIGDDWKGNERWERTGKEMEALGARLVYLPYTKDTSSTMLREKLKEY